MTHAQKRDLRNDVQRCERRGDLYKTRNLAAKSGVRRSRYMSTEMFLLLATLVNVMCLWASAACAPLQPRAVRLHNMVLCRYNSVIWPACIQDMDCKVMHLEQVYAALWTIDCYRLCRSHYLLLHRVLLKLQLPRTHSKTSPKSTSPLLL